MEGIVVERSTRHGTAGVMLVMGRVLLTGKAHDVSVAARQGGLTTLQMHEKDARDLMHALVQYFEEG